MHKDITREKWLTDACEHFLDTLIMPVVNNEYTRPNIKISIGWMYRSAKSIGQCFRRSSSAGNVNEIFIRPDYDKSLRILDILIHEIIHAVDDCESGHRGFFRSTAKGVGLSGKMTATVAGEELTATLTAYIEEHGDIPHAALQTDQSTTKKQSTRMLKLECGTCGFTARMSNKWLEQIDTDEAFCPCCGSQGELMKV
ncbi:MAG: hypothetical protein QQN63_00695 [Nitrosopumilus sp.]